MPSKTCGAVQNEQARRIVCDYKQIYSNYEGCYALSHPILKTIILLFEILGRCLFNVWIIYFWMWITEFSTANIRLILGSNSVWGVLRRLLQLKLILTHPKFLPRRHGWNFSGSATYPLTTTSEEEEEETSSSTTMTTTTTKEALTPTLLLWYPPHQIATAPTATLANYYQSFPSLSSSSWTISSSIYAYIGLFATSLDAFLASGGSGTSGRRRRRRRM